MTRHVYKIQYWCIYVIYISSMTIQPELFIS